jgi:hypothetical protein
MTTRAVLRESLAKSEEFGQNGVVVKDMRGEL